MHEVGLAMEMVDIAARHAGERRVTRVIVEVGALSCVSADALRFAFEVAAKDTAADGAELDVRTIPARVSCRECRVERETTDPWARCPCGGLDLAFEGGDELRVKAIELV
jgi:hydrogenase nickel incorporation protein HypA/HybF